MTDLTVDEWSREDLRRKIEDLAEQLKAAREDLQLAHIRLADISDWPTDQLTGQKARKHAQQACEDLDAATAQRGELWRLFRA